MNSYNTGMCGVRMYHAAHTEVRRQLLRFSYLLPPCRSQEQNAAAGQPVGRRLNLPNAATVNAVAHVVVTPNPLKLFLLLLHD